MVGYVKHINAGAGTVLYRGQCDLYEKVIPSIYHDRGKIIHNNKLLNQAIQNIFNDEPFLHFLGFRNTRIQGWQLYEKLIIEAVLQHYGAKTYCVDFVDNHWTALWFGLYRWNTNINSYIIRSDGESDLGKKFISYNKNYCKQELPLEPTIESVSLDTDKIKELMKNASHGTITLEALIEKHRQSRLKSKYREWNKQCRSVNEHNLKYDNYEQASHLYLFLYVSETNSACINGLYLGEETYTIDLRKALPSTFLRPCSQHGWVVRGIKDDFDFNTNICCIIRINVDLAKQMLGSGTLLSQENFFPDENVDQGYNILLQRQKDSRIETAYNKLLPSGMIPDFYA